MVVLVNNKSIRTFLIFIFLLFSSFAIQASHKFEAIIFDCDGVLVDTEPLKYQAWRKTFGNNGIDFTLSEYFPLVGFSSKYILTSVLENKNINFISIERIIREKEEIYKLLQRNGVPEIVSATTFVRNLKKSTSLKLGLASSASRKEILENLKQLRLTNVFDKIVSGSDDLKEFSDSEGVNKPKPYIYTKIAKLLKVKPKNCVVFEDTEAGVMAAKLAGMYVIAVPNEYTKHQNFKQADGIIITLDGFDIKKLI